MSAVTTDALVRAAKRGPRYTSYPPATEFRSDFGPADALAELRTLAERPGEPVSLYLHVPYCRSLCWYCGCNVTITRDRQRGTSYVDRLLEELAMVSRATGPHPLAELSLGGGSPNFLDPDELARLTDAVRAAFPPSADAELGIELDPRDTTDEQVEGLAKLGFTRLSVGVQDFAQEVQEVINRQQSFEQTRDLIAHARAAGFRSSGIDLIYGLPLQTPATLTRTIEHVVDIGPERIALFGYAHVPQMRPAQKLVARHGLPGVEERAGLFLLAVERLVAAGYQRVGFDHFARPDDPLARAARDGTLRRNFQGFTVPRGEAVIACGASAISDSGGAYWQNHPNVDEWERALAAGELPVVRGIRLSPEDRLRREVIYALMCRDRLDWTSLGIPDFDAHFATELASLEGGEFKELVEVSREHHTIAPTPLGRELIRNVCMVFDRYVDGRKPASTTI